MDPNPTAAAITKVGRKSAGRTHERTFGVTAYPVKDGDETAVVVRAANTGLWFFRYVVAAPPPAGTLASPSPRPGLAASSAFEEEEDLVSSTPLLRAGLLSLATATGLIIAES